MARIFFRQWLRLWKMPMWWLFIFGPYLIAPIYGEIWMPTWKFPIGVILMSFVFVGLGFVLMKVTPNDRE